MRGNCNAGLKTGDTFLFDGFQFSAEDEENEWKCPAAFATITANIGRLKLQHGSILVSCPDPGTGAGGNVIFELSRGDG